MKLFSYYSLDECADRKKVIGVLKGFVKEGKIEYDLDKNTDVFSIEDIDLEDEEIEQLCELFEDLDVFPYLEFEDEEDEDDPYGGYEDEDEDDY